MSRYYISDAPWKRLAPCFARHVKNVKEGRVRIHALRLMVSCEFSIPALRGVHLPDEFGPWQTVCKRFNMWAKSSIWESILSNLAEDADFEVVMVDGSYVRAHQHSAGAKGGAKPKPSDEAGEA